MATIATDTLDSQYSAMREGCGVLDRSDRGKLALTGPDALEFLNGQVTNELLDLRAGEGRYAAFLTHKGKMLGDLRILAAGADAGDSPAETAGPPDASSAPAQLLLDTERVALQALFDMIRRFKVGYRVDLHKRTLERGLLSLIGPQADAIAGTGALANEEHANARTQIADTPVLTVRTDVGVELLCDATDTQGLLAALRERGATPICKQAAECMRVERGRPRYGIDLDDTVIPQEAGLNERAVSFTKGCYVGQETVARLYYRGKPNRHLRGLALSAPVDTGDELALGERTVGRVGSFASSPRLGPIALALVRREAPPGSSLNVGERGVSAEVVELPFPQD